MGRGALWSWTAWVHPPDEPVSPNVGKLPQFLELVRELNEIIYVKSLTE